VVTSDRAGPALPADSTTAELRSVDAPPGVSPDGYRSGVETTTDGRTRAVDRR
jgi:hypothetical protein